LLHIERLRGGISAQVHAVHFSLPGGERGKFVVRREKPGDFDPLAFAREFQLLGMLERAGVPAPRPILFDGDGAYFGTPAIVISFAGRPLMVPPKLQPWIDDLALALARVHSVTPAQFDLSFLPNLAPDGIRDAVLREPGAKLAGDPLAEEIAAALRDRVSKVTWVAPTLVHGDYWSGNTVWSRNRLSGVIDWSDAMVNDPRLDVAECRMDLATAYGLEAADSFLAEVQARRPIGELPDMPFFDLFRGMRALRNYESWLPGYHDFGTHLDLTTQLMRKRLETILRRALDSAP